MFLQLTPYDLPMNCQLSEIASAHWIPLGFFLPLNLHIGVNDSSRWRTIPLSISRVFVPDNFLAGNETWKVYTRSGLRRVIHWGIGEIYYKGILLPNEYHPYIHGPDKVKKLPRAPSPIGYATAASTHERLLLWYIICSLILTTPKTQLSQ